MDWININDRLPEYNKLVQCWVSGAQEHSGVMWKREGLSEMVRHDSDKFTVENKFSAEYYDNALMKHGADYLSVTHWQPLPERPE